MSSPHQRHWEYNPSGAPTEPGSFSLKGVNANVAYEVKVEITTDALTGLSKKGLFRLTVGQYELFFDNLMLAKQAGDAMIADMEEFFR